MIEKVFNILLEAYGPQGWWPLTPEGSFETKHHSGRPNTEQKKFEIMVEAILTQNTSWSNVEKAIFNLNSSSKLTLYSFDKIEIDTLAELIKPAGYYNQKAKHLKALTKFIKENNGSNNLFNQENLREALLSVKGIGPETADSIILYSAEKPIFVIDAYTKRIFSRLGYDRKDYDDWQDLFMGALEPDTKVFNEYHALIVQHAKIHCRAKPLCEGCPIRKLCRNIK